MAGENILKTDGFASGIGEGKNQEIPG